MTTSPYPREMVVPLSAMTADALRARARDLLRVLNAPETAATLRQRAVALVGADLGCSPAEVPLDEPIEDLGLSPAALLGLRGLLEATGDGARPPDGARATLGAFGAPPANARTPARGLRLEDIAFTLACGRDPMPVRLAVVTDTLDGLRTGLEQWLAGDAAPRGVFDPERADRESGTAGEAALLARSWADGSDVDWESVHAGGDGRRISLPAYRFDSREHWVPAPGMARAPSPVAAAATGPSVTRRVIASDEPVVAEHLVSGRPTVPGVVHLSMSHGEAVRVLGSATEARDVVWSRTATVPADGLPLTFTTTAAGAATAEVTAADADGNRYCEFTWHAVPEAPGESGVDIEQCRRHCRTTLSAEAFYTELRARGLEYGPLFRGLDQLRVGDGLVLARAESARSTGEPLDPTLLDAALQSVAVLRLADGAADLPLPFAADRIAVRAPLPARAWIVTRERDSRYDIDVADESGRVAVRIEGLRVRRRTPELSGRPPAVPSPIRTADASRSGGVVTAVPVWRPEPSPHGPDRTAGASALVVSDGELPDDLAARLHDRYGGRVTFVPLRKGAPATGTWADVWVLAASGEASSDDPSAPARRVFATLHDLLHRGVLRAATSLNVAVGDVYGLRGGAPEHPFSAGIVGMVRSLSQELRELDVRLLALEAAPDAGLPDLLDAEPRIAPGRDVCIGRDGTRRVRRLAPVSMPAPKPLGAFRTGGTYLIAGGAGGIGTALAKHLSGRYRAHVVLTGRSPMNADLRAQVDAVAEQGGTAEYRTVDVSDRAGTRRLVDEVEAERGLDGVVHAAMTLDDGIFENQTPERFAEALSPKLDGTVSLLEAVAGHAVDLVLVLGSIQSFTGAPGQSSYAAASTGQDALVQWGRRALGLPVAVAHLGPWSEVGAVSAPDRVEAMRRSGWEGLTVAEGIGVIEALAATGLRSLAGLKATPAALWHAGLDAQARPVGVWESDELAGVSRTSYEDVESLLATEALAALDATECRSAASRRYEAALRAVARRAQPANGRAVRDRDASPLDGRIDLARQCFRRLPEWAAGTVTAHESLFTGGESSPLSRFYRGEPFNERAQDIMAGRLLALADERGRRRSVPLRILEVGAGVGSTTVPLVRRLRASGHPFHYQVTDISERLLAQTRDLLGTEHLEFARLDLTDPAGLQPFAGCDVIVAGNVLHAVPGLDAVLARLRTALADDGVLMISELVSTSVFHTAVFGLFDGWWPEPGDRRRIAHSPLLDAAAWRDCIEAQGWAPAHVTAIAPHGGSDLHAVFTAQKEPDMPVNPPHGQVPPRAAESVAGAAERAAPSGDAAESRVRELIVRQTASTLGMAVAEVGLDQPFAAMGVDSLVGVDLVGAIGAELGIVLKTIVIFDHPTVARLAAHIVAAHGTSLDLPPAAGGTRGAEHPRTAAPVPAGAPEPVRATGAAGKPTDAVGVLFTAPANGIDARTAPIEVGPPGPGQLEIAVRAFPINFSDDLVARGLYPMMPDFPVVPGVEVSGVVTRVGPGVSGIEPGEEVIALTRPDMGGQATAVVVDADFAVRKPVGISHEDACGTPAGYLAMSVALDLAAPRPGETVLITGATGNNGMIALQLAGRTGARVIGTASTPEKVAHLESMGVQGICRTGDVVAELHRLTGGAGADVVINTLGGDAIREGLRSVGRGGRYVETAVFGLQAAGPLDLSSFVDNQSFFSLNGKKYFLDHPEERSKYLRRLAADLESGDLVPAPSAVFDFADVAAAYRAKGDRDRIGRVVVRVGNGREVPRAADRAPAATAREPREEDLAIVGMAARYAGSPDLDRYWEALADGVDLRRPVPDERWDRERYFDADPERTDTTYCDRGYFLDDIDAFDPAFFGMSVREATQTDPQQRLFLQEAWRALEIAGTTRSRNRRTGVFVGAGPSGYEGRMNLAGAVRQAQSFWGNDSSVLAARISYALDLGGPSIAVNTACSSSLVALHLARRSLLDGDCDAALAGGVFLMTDPQYFVVASNGRMLAPDGRSKTFSADADGFGPGEGVGVVLLRRLSDAIADGDHVWGVIRGSAVNQDGRTNGITAPNGLAQTAVVRQAMRDAGVDPGSIDYVEAHGTGTRLGDPIEVEALTSAFRSTTDDRAFCALGSAKAVIGHTAAAAGVAGVIKVCLAFERERLPGMPPTEALNPLIDFAASPFTVAQERPWPRVRDRPRRAGVSSFGFSGTNAHAILEEPPRTEPRGTARGPWLFPVSAHEPELLTRHLAELAAWVRAAGSRYGLDDLADTLQTRREHGPVRCVVAAGTRAELAAALEAAAPGGLLLGDWAESYEADREALVRFATSEEAPWPRSGESPAGRAVPVPPRPFRQERYWFPEDDQWHRHRPAGSADEAAAPVGIEAVVDAFLAGSYDEDEALRRLEGQV